MYMLVVGHFLYSNIVQTVGPHFAGPPILKGPCQDPAGFVTDEPPDCPRYSCGIAPSPDRVYLVVRDGREIPVYDQASIKKNNRGFPFQYLWLEDYDHCSGIKVEQKSTLSLVLNFVYLTLITFGARAASRFKSDQSIRLKSPKN
jgi:hypothetical protein